MSATISLKSTRPRRSDATLSFIQCALIIVGLVLLVGTVKPAFSVGSNSDDEQLQLFVAEPTAPLPAAPVPETAAAQEVALPATVSPSLMAEEEASVAIAEPPPVQAVPAAKVEAVVEAPEPAPEALRPSLQRALDYVSNRYRVAPEALVPIFEAAQSVGRERKLDPLLIIAIIGIESRFNPFAESSVGAQGLMQVMPGIHKDKLPEDAGAQPFLDPVTNIQVGVHVLEEAIRWRGSLTGGLQHYAGSATDPATGYAKKVYAEKQRLEKAAKKRTSKSRA
ncbi:MAG: lytic murein transglycosylase [Candidatus Accumulibacter appositus]|uniref:Lytic murein transglycosylase n=1 Tax=Candidatus Accumulibacter appositus TaxID=1454003 RepID=A0A011PNJ9_9PROT|nr:lytic transglycosylase domain-containing protein [Accumulibacter sp.]EXI78587.1 MAG: lytic murein transglycosylase [Candidatus Accumulibacter appositus]HRF03552.1 lytic transglycosylase domain-containing protein [Accumulibacter sp.]